MFFWREHQSYFKILKYTNQGLLRLVLKLGGSISRIWNVRCFSTFYFCRNWTSWAASNEPASNKHGLNFLLEDAHEASTWFTKVNVELLLEGLQDVFRFSFLDRWIKELVCLSTLNESILMRLWNLQGRLSEYFLRLLHCFQWEEASRIFVKYFSDSMCFLIFKVKSTKIDRFI